MADVIPIRYSDLSLLHPIAERAFRELGMSLEADYVKGKIDVRFMPYETYRYPQRQLYFYRKGTSRAMPFRSAHQFGLAVDFVPFQAGSGFTWEVDTKAWDWLRARSREQGLVNELSWDRAHVEHPIWDKVRQVLFYK